MYGQLMKMSVNFCVLAWLMNLHIWPSKIVTEKKSRSRFCAHKWISSEKREKVEASNWMAFIKHSSTPQNRSGYSMNEDNFVSSEKSLFNCVLFTFLSNLSVFVFVSVSVSTWCIDGNWIANAITAFEMKNWFAIFTTWNEMHGQFSKGIKV